MRANICWIYTQLINHPLQPGTAWGIHLLHVIEVLSQFLSRDRQLPTSQCTYTHQYARGATAGFRYTGAAAQISILILMEKKGCGFNSRSPSGLPRRSGEMGKSPWKWQHDQHCNDEGFMGCFSRSKRGKRKGNLCRELVIMLVSAHNHKAAVCKVFPTAHTHSTWHIQQNNTCFIVYAHIRMPAK